MQIEKAKKMIKNHIVDAATKRGAMKHVKEKQGGRKIEKIEEACYEGRYDNHKYARTNKGDNRRIPYCIQLNNNRCIGCMYHLYMRF